MQLTENFDLLNMEEAPQNKPLEWVKALVLIGLALYFAYNIVSGQLPNYINVRFIWLSYLAVVIFGVLGGASIYALFRQMPLARDGSHTPVSWSMLLLVALPLVMGTLIPSKPLGAAAVDGKIETRVATVMTSATITQDPLTRNVLDWLRVFQRDTPASFNGQEADVIGFVYREPGYAGGQFMVARFTVACCVADANAIGLPVMWEGITDIADNEWVQVHGTFDARDFNGNMMPVLIANSVTVIEQPKHPYVYP